MGDKILRPPKNYDDLMIETLTCKIEPRYKAAFCEMCDRKGIKVSAMLRDLALRAIEKDAKNHDE